MKKQLLLVFVLLLSITGCNNTPGNTTGESKSSSNIPVEMEDVSITFSGIAFTKSVNDATKYYSIENNRLSIDAVTGSNYFISPDGARAEATAPILLTEIDNTKPFTFTTRMETPIEKIYDAGTVYVFLDNSRWLKYAFECDEKHRNRVVTVRTEGSSDDNNHDIINQNYVFLRISSNVKQIGFYYSLDGTDWNLARIYRNEYPAKIWLGLSSQSPKEGKNIAHFEDMVLTDSYIGNHRLGE